MSGHSKWAQIKHKKAITDAKKSKIFSKLAALISIAAREKGGGASMNPKLRLAVEKARAMNMPMENIERAIKRGTGGIESGNLEELLLEAYGPGGKAILISAITDNKNRTLVEIKHILNEYGGKLASSGSVRWMFEEKGKIILENQKLNEDMELKIIEAGAEDIKIERGEIIILTKPEDLELVKQEIIKAKMEISETSLDFIPKTSEKISEEERGAYEKLFEALDEQQDVEEIYSNIEF